MLFGNKAEIQDLKSEIEKLKAEVQFLQVKIERQNQYLIDSLSNYSKDQIDYQNREFARYLHREKQEIASYIRELPHKYEDQLTKFSQEIKANRDLLEKAISIVKENQIQIGQIKNNQINILTRGSYGISDQSTNTIDQKEERIMGDKFEQISNAKIVNRSHVDNAFNTNASEQKTSLAEAAAEIQKLLKQLEESNPTATEPEQVAYINAATKPDLKQRTIAALKEGGDTAIDEFVLQNKYLKVVKAVVKGWLQPAG